jgi:hypothetical protein
MLSIYQVALDMTGEIHRLIDEIRVHDRKLADQLKDAWSSVVLTSPREAASAAATASSAT